jgi:hypothetical protein
MKGR